MQEKNFTAGSYMNVRPPRILSNSSKELEIANATNSGTHKRRNSTGYMAPTTVSALRRKNGLNLRDKIFELHDAVKEL